MSTLDTTVTGGENQPDSTAHVDTTKTDNSDIDYKTRAEELEKELGQAQHTIIKLKSKKDNTKDQDDESLDDDSIDQKVKSTVEEALSKDRSLRVTEIVDEEIAKITSNPDEQKLIKLLFNQKIVKGGNTRQDIVKDLHAARVLANAPKIEANLKEVAEVAKANLNTSNVISSSGAQFASDLSDNQTNWNEADKGLLQAYGVKI